MKLFTLWNHHNDCSLNEDNLKRVKESENFLKYEGERKACNTASAGTTSKQLLFFAAGTPGWSNLHPSWWALAQGSSGIQLPSWTCIAHYQITRQCIFMQGFITQCQPKTLFSGTTPLNDEAIE